MRKTSREALNFTARISGTGWSQALGLLGSVSMMVACSANLSGGGEPGSKDSKDVGPDGGGGTTSSTGGTGNGGAASIVCDEAALTIGRAPLRRLTRFEFNKSAEYLLGDTSSPGDTLPPELSGNGFGNDADSQPISSFLVEQYASVAEGAAQRAIDDPSFMSKYAPCYANVDPSTQASCARTFIENFSEKAYRRPLSTEEVDELVQLQQDLEALSDYATSLTLVVDAILQSPDFLYRIELGDPDATPGQPVRPSDYEMANRLSYFFWGAPPDEELERAARDGELSSAEGVLAQAQRMILEPGAKEVIRFFFGRFLPIEGLTDLARDSTEFSTFSPQIGALMRKETEAFIEYEIFEGPGDWKSALTAPYTFVNEPLAKFYGMDNVTGDEFQKVDVDTTRRRGLLTQGSVLTGTTVSNFTNPVRRGIFLLRDVMCVELPDPPQGLVVAPPNPTSGATGRERYSAHAESPVCTKCHSVMDPPGFALENYDAVGLWRDQENGVDIDSSGKIDALPDAFSGPLELVQLIAENEQTHACFAEKWLTFAAGRNLTEEDHCLKEKLDAQFAASGYDIKELLLNITQTDAFLYMPAKETP